MKVSGCQLENSGSRGVLALNLMSEITNLFAYTNLSQQTHFQCSFSWSVKIVPRWSFLSDDPFVAINMGNYPVWNSFHLQWSITFSFASHPPWNYLALLWARTELNRYLRTNKYLLFIWWNKHWSNIALFSTRDYVIIKMNHILNS